MKKLVILGAGTAGTMMLNKLTAILEKHDWHITVVDQEEKHCYQPGFLFIPFDMYTCKDVIKPKRDVFPAGATVIMSSIDRIEPDANRVILGDATNLPSSKAGSVAHFQADVLLENFLSVVEGRAPAHQFDGHANCFIESGFGKGILIDFNYDTEPLPGNSHFRGSAHSLCSKKRNGVLWHVS